MTPHFFVGHNHVFQPPEGWDRSKGDCSPLPVMVDGEGIMSVWKPSPDELAALIAGGGIVICLGQHVQPVMSVGACRAEALLVSA